jgi:hypothetical protein
MRERIDIVLFSSSCLLYRNDSPIYRKIYGSMIWAKTNGHPPIIIHNKFHFIISREQNISVRELLITVRNENYY